MKLSRFFPFYYLFGLLAVGHLYGQTQTGTSPNGTQKAITVPIQNYAVIDLAGTSGSNIGVMSLNDSNVAWFGGDTDDISLTSTYGTGPSGATIQEWTNGAVVSGGGQSLTYPNEDANVYDYGSYVFYYGYFSNLLDTSGNLFGQLYYNGLDTEDLEYFTPQVNGFEGTGGGFSSIGLPDPPLPSVMPTTEFGIPTIPELIGEYQEPISLSVANATKYGYCGQMGSEWLVTSTSAFGNGYSWFGGSSGQSVIGFSSPGFIHSTGTSNFWYIFMTGIDGWSVSSLPVTSGSNFLITDTPFNPQGMNDVGGIIGTGAANSPVVWTTGTFTSLGLTYAADINNQGEIVGTGSSSTYPSGEGAITYSGSYGNISFLCDTLSGNIKGQIFGVQPAMVSNTNPADGSFTVFSSAFNADGPSFGTPNWENFIWRCDNQGNWTFAQANVPQGTSINDFVTINSSDVIAAIGSPPWLSGVNHPLLLLPVAFQPVYYSSGFDPVSQPNWLMVPQNGSNSAISITPASAILTASFPVIPSSPDPTASPASTSSSSQTITVSGTTVGESFQVQVGIGATVESGSESSGLCIDVKPMVTGTVAIHAVTQHYTQPMAPPSVSGSFAPGRVCVQADPTGHIGTLTTVPISPDYANAAGTQILTGSDGICHTEAMAPDAQLIKVGQGIPADIVPQDVPSASAMQAYLAEVFGTQANLFLAVSRKDFSTNYDVKKDGKLDVALSQDAQSSGQRIINAYATTNATFNVYYVADYQGLPLSGTIPIHKSTGFAYYPFAIAYVRDWNGPGQYTLANSAHEIGHLLDLTHTNLPLLPDLKTPNPASTSVIPDPQAVNRLMYEYCSGSNTLLIKPEWDIVNPTPR